MNIIGMKKTVSYALFICSTLLSNCIFAAQTAAPFTTAYRYDIGGQLTATILPDPDGAGPLGYPATRNTYNSRGLLEREEVGELVSWQDETIAPSSWSTSQFKIETTKVFYYDDLGRKTIQARLNKQGTTETLVQFNYDHVDRVNCKTIRLSAKGYMPAAYSNLPDACTPSNSAYGKDRVTQYAYNNIGQVETETRALGTSLAQVYVKNIYGDYGLLKQQIDANGNVTELEYDANMRLYRRYYPSKKMLAGQSPSSPGTPNKTDGFNEYRYDLNGNINYERKRNGKVITFGHDNNNRMILKDLADNTYSQDIDYNYDLRGLTLHSKFGSAAGEGVTNTFDGFGNLASSTINMAGSSRTLNYLYDENGNRERTTHPDGNYFKYAFDGINRVNALLENGSNSVLNVVYKSNGRRDSISRTGGATTSYGFDDLVRLSNFTQTFSDTTKTLSTSFVYSPANQVIELTYSNNLYHYQGNENRTGVYIPNGLNQYEKINNQPIDHDTNGNLINDGTIMYIYDDENRLVSTSGAATSSFKYDPLGRLFETTINGTKTQFLYDGDALVAEYDSSGVLQRRYVHGDQVDEPWVQYNGSSVSASNRRYLYANHQGSIIAHSNNAGTVNTLAYDSYGIPATTNIDRFGYTGQIWFKDLGLFHYKARMYSPKLGRFMQTDPIFYADNMNMYAYVGNDPVNKTDPSGMAQCDKSLSAEQCQTALADADSARFDIQTAKSGVEGMAQKLKNGDKLNAGEQKALGVIGERFGKQFTTEKGLGKLSSGLGKIHDKIGERGSGAILARGNDKDLTKSAYVLSAAKTGFFNGNKIYLNSGHLNQTSNSVRSMDMVHEAAHLNRFMGDSYRKSGIDALLQSNPEAVENNADTFACMVYPSDCGY